MSLSIIYQAQVRQLQKDAEKIGRSIAEADQVRSWQLGALDGWDGDLRNIAGPKESFRREDLNQEYVRLAGPGNGKCGQNMMIKMQVDWLAIQERALRLRQQSWIRSQCHAAARRLGHASEAGPLKRGQNYLQELLAQTQGG